MAKAPSSCLDVCYFEVAKIFCCTAGAWSPWTLLVSSKPRSILDAGLPVAALDFSKCPCFSVRTASKCCLTSCVGVSSHFPLSLVVSWLQLKLKRCWAVVGYGWENKSSLFSCLCGCVAAEIPCSWVGSIGGGEIDWKNLLFSWSCPR